MGEEGWRTPVDAHDYLLGEKKRLALDQRRPVIRRASDLVGPGIASGAVRISDFNDPLATFNGYYSAVAGAPNAPTTTEAFIGQVVSDEELGGRQVFTGLSTNTEYSRTFSRNPSDVNALVWGKWTGERIPASGQGLVINSLTVPENVQTILRPPDMIYLGAGAATFERSNFGLRIKRPGIYTGHIQVGANTLAAAGNVGIELPQGPELYSVMHLNVLLTPTVYYPFTIWTVSGVAPLISVNIFQVDPTPTKFWYRLSITRVGDSV